MYSWVFAWLKRCPITVRQYFLILKIRLQNSWLYLSIFSVETTLFIFKVLVDFMIGIFTRIVNRGIVSSANVTTLLSLYSPGKSIKFRKKNNGPNTDLWSTPGLIRRRNDWLFFGADKLDAVLRIKTETFLSGSPDSIFLQFISNYVIIYH